MPRHFCFEGRDRLDGRSSEREDVAGRLVDLFGAAGDFREVQAINL
jgi:hypothetical protein